MPHPDVDSEAALETATMALFYRLGWETVDAFDETFSEHQASPGTPYLGRAHRGEVVLRPRLLAALRRLNPLLPDEALREAAEVLTRDRSAMALPAANREIYEFLKDGVRVSFKDPDGEEQVERVRVIDWLEPENNEFLLVQQLWVTGDVYTKRADLVGFVNGLPLLFGELKAHYRRLEDAFQGNLSDYKETIPHLFGYNALIVLSNGSASRIGTITSPWEHFSEWKKINDEGETGVISLETLVRGTCERARFLDIVENFVLYQDVRGGLNKIVAKNHQYLGVNSAIEAVQDIRQNQGRLGVFWHTQGSGKSFSMIFFGQKILRRVHGHWTFLIVTDRVDLDNQIFKNFAGCGAVTEPEERARAQSGKHLKTMLREDHRYIFTLIHKFYTRNGERYPKLSDRSDIVVITDEAHRTQYDVLAMNMRNALPNAAFIGFTATPLIASEEKTRAVFGDYVSVYNFRQSVQDRATVPLYYENRIPELQLKNEHLNEDMLRLLEDAELDEDQEAKLKRVFKQQYHLITREDRLDKVAEDIVRHFVGRGYPGKGMVVSIDKVTTVRMFDKVQEYWQRALREKKKSLAHADPEKGAEIEAEIEFMESTDMAVVISQAQNEVRTFQEKGLDIRPHRKRMINEDLDEKFKDPEDAFRLVFVCAMWRTGFDAPSCSTIYLDRPMRNHTLMQTIARANRVFGEKNNGLIVDYVGTFRDLQKALAIYGTGPSGELLPGECPVEPKSELVQRLRDALAEATDFCAHRGVHVEDLLSGGVFEHIAMMDTAVERIIVNDENKLQYLGLVGNVDRLFRAILPDILATEFAPRRKLLVVLAEKIRALTPPADISGIMDQVEALLDRSVNARAYVIEPGEKYDLSKIDFKALKTMFEKGHKRTEAARLRRTIEAKLQRMVSLNHSRMNYLEEFKRLIDEHNAGSRNVQEFFDELLEFTRRLNQEEQRAIAENLDEEQLAVFDILTQPNLDLTEKQKEQVKKVARELLETLKQEKLVLDWRKRQQTRASVRLCIEQMLDRLPQVFAKELYRRLCGLVYQHVYDMYFGRGQSVYARAGV